MSFRLEKAGIASVDLESRLSENRRGLSLREELESDRAFLEDLYASTRAGEVSVLPWPDSEKQAFLGQQFEAQRSHYRRYYPDAGFMVILRDGVPAGRLYIDLTPSELRLMDIALLPEHRGQGLGSMVMDSVLWLASGHATPVTLHVEPFNPARKWYERLGFEIVEQRGVYLFMRLEERHIREAQEKLIS